MAKHTRREFVASTTAVVAGAPLARAAAADPEARVRMVNGAPAFVVDGKPITGLSYMTYQNNYSTENGRPALPQNVRFFAEAGCELYTFVTDLGGLYGYTQTIWPAPDRWDFSQVDAIARMVLDAAPPNAKLILQLYIDTPKWWADAHPDDLFRLSTGSADFGDKLFALPRRDNLPSIASPRWREDCKRMIDAFIAQVEHTELGERVIGYQVTGQKTQEWYHWSMNTEDLGDYSPCMRDAFRTWLRERYRIDDRLRAAWSQPGAALATAAIPSRQERYGDRTRTFRDPAREQHVIDFHIFWSDIMVDTIADFARFVKTRTRRRKVVGAFYGYTLDFGQLGEDAGHLALHRLLRCPDIDFVMSPSSYQRRDLKGGQSCFRLPVGSINLHGRMHWCDFDPASFKFYAKDQKVYGQWKPWLAVTDTAEEYTWMIRRELGNALASGVNMAHFDLHGGYYDDPTLVAEVRRAQEIRRRALATDRRSIAQILVLVDERSQHYLRFRDPISTTLIGGQWDELPFVAPYDVALLDDLPRLVTRPYRMAVVLNAWVLDAGQRRLLREKLASGGRHVVWLYAPGYLRANRQGGDVAGIAEVTGIAVAARPKPAPGATAIFAEADHLTAPLLDAEQFVVTDPAAMVLARRSDGEHEVVVAKRAFGGWTSVYSAVAPVPRQVLRGIAADAGVHLYDDDSGDSVYANRCYLTVAAGANAGRRTLHLPRRAGVVDLESGQRVCSGADYFTVDFRAFEVRMFRVEDSGTALCHQHVTG